MARLNDPAKEQQVEIQIAHSRREYARVVELFKARQATSLNRPAQSFGEMPGRGAVGYYAAMADWRLGNIPSMRERIEMGLRVANPEGSEHPLIQSGIAVLRRREGRDAEMRTASREGMQFMRDQLEAGSESPRYHFTYALMAWLLGDRAVSDQEIDRAMQAGYLLGKPDQIDMLPEALAENPKFAAALVAMNQKIEVQRALIRELERQFP